MRDTLDPLIDDLVAWCAPGPRAYAEVLDAWRTSCPRLTVWEEACARGLVETRSGPAGLVVVVTPAGLTRIGHRAPRQVPPRVAAPIAATARA